MMTRNYGCGIETSKKYFLEEIRKNNREINKEDIKKILKLFNNFYKFISKEITITEEKTDKILEYFKNNSYNDINLSDGSKASIVYYELIDKRIDTKIESIRYTHIKKQRTDVIDMIKTNIALVANYIHVLDSSLARDVVCRIPCFIIHDCFIIGCLEVSSLIDTINICFNTNYDKK
jgi:hypothetical protein